MYANLPLFLQLETLGLETGGKFPESPSEVVGQLWLEAQLLTPRLSTATHASHSQTHQQGLLICLFFLQTLAEHLQGDEKEIRCLNQ